MVSDRTASSHDRPSRVVRRNPVKARGRMPAAGQIAGPPVISFQIAKNASFGFNALDLSPKLVLLMLGDSMGKSFELSDDIGAESLRSRIVAGQIRGKDAEHAVGMPDFQ